MATLAGKSCAVCFTPAELRCSACAKAGGVDLFFCSTEHQKLAWPTHKKVCGATDPRSCHPIFFPPLTKTEVDEAKRDLHKVPPQLALAAALMPGSPKSLWDGFRTGGLKEDQVNMVLDNLSQPVIKWHPYPGAVISHGQLNRTVRYYRALNHFGKPFTEPFPLLADFQTSFTTDAGMKGKLFDPRPEIWYSEMCHRALCFFAAMQQKAKELGTGPEYRWELQQAYGQWTMAMGIHLRQKKPDVVEHLVHAMTGSLAALRGDHKGPFAE